MLCDICLNAKPHSLVTERRRKLGAFRTKPGVVRLILDMVGYRCGRSIENKSVLDVGCGNGIFLLEALRRSHSWSEKRKSSSDAWIRHVRSKFVGYEIDPRLCREARDRISSFMTARAKASELTAQEVARKIIVQGDFLSWRPIPGFDFVIGNFPWVRYDRLSSRYARWLMKNYSCFRGRADLSVPFVQHSLELLANKSSRLGFICSNRFAFCEYGKPLRQLIGSDFKITKVLDLTNADPFQEELSTYPWSYVVQQSNGASSEVQVYKLRKSGSSVQKKVCLKRVKYSDFLTNQWHLNPRLVKLWKKVTTNHSAKLGDEGFGIDIKVGLATGADSVFINPPADAHIEQGLLTPIMLASDFKVNKTNARSAILLNTWDPTDPQKPIKLRDWPNASRYLRRNKKLLESRHVAKKHPREWYRLIDHLDPSIISAQKLVFPSLRRKLEVYFETGLHAIHHNCYYAVKTDSGGPTLKTIGALLSSQIVSELASTLAITFRGSAQRLMKSDFLEIPMPEPSFLLDRESEFEDAFSRQDSREIDALAQEAYDLDQIQARAGSHSSS
jgi:adenine-specific DNA-methyltransferase